MVIITVCEWSDIWTLRADESAVAVAVLQLHISRPECMPFVVLHVVEWTLRESFVQYSDKQQCVRSVELPVG